jgi:hypothetical protein
MRQQDFLFFVEVSMGKYPDKVRARAVQQVEADPIEYIDRSSAANPFFSFSYSYREISSVGGKTVVKSKETRFENGRLKSEEFEGTLDGTAYADMARQAQQSFMSQMTFFLNQLSLFAPFRKENRKKTAHS